MKSIVQEDFNGIDKLKIENLSTPKLNPMSILVRTKFTPVLPFDWLTEEGKLKQINPVKLPKTIGYGFSGIIENVGALRNKNLIGKKVIGMNPQGSAQELVSTPLIFQLPDNVSMEDGTTLIGGADAAQLAVNKIDPQKKDIIIITGATGGVGTYLIQMLKDFTIIALSSQKNIQFLKYLGANYVIDYQKNISEQLANLPRANKVIDTVGSIKLLDQISNFYQNLHIFSLSIQNYLPTKKQQTFHFSNGTIGINGYKSLINKLADKQLIPIIQDIFPFTKVKEAQHTAKNKHLRGRILLKY